MSRPAFGFFDSNSTPEQLARRRAELDFLASGMGRAQNVGQGIGDMLRGIGVGLGRYRANKQENAGIEGANKAWSAFNPFGPSQPPAPAPQVSAGAVFPNPAIVAPQTPQTRLPAGMRPMSEPAMGAMADAGAVRPSMPVTAPQTPKNGNWLQYANQGATRNQPLNPKLTQSLSFLPEMGVSMKVFSGGQDATGPRRTGSHRHDGGNAGDVFFYKDGKQLDWRNQADIPMLQQIVTRARANGVTGFGAGEGYMQPGSMHIGFGNPAVWGNGGSGANAPDWLRQAFNSKYTPQGQQAPTQMASNDPQGSFAMPTSAPPNDMAQAQPIPEPMQTQQVAQAQPQPQPQGADNSKLQQLWELSQNQFLNPNQQAMAKMLLEQEMQKQDPAYQMKMQQNSIDLETGKLQLDQLKNPKAKVEHVGNSLVKINPNNTVERIYTDETGRQRRTQIATINGQEVLTDMDTGDAIKVLGKSPAKQDSAPQGHRFTADGKSLERIPGYRDTSLEMDMRKEFDAQTKDFRAVRDSYNRIQSSAENPTPAGDLSLIFNYMKMLDPGSVVRESEFAVASNAAPLLTRYGLDPEKLKGIWAGQKLTPEQRADFLTRSEQLYGEQDQTFQSLADQYSETAKRNGLNPDNIILTPRQNPRKKKSANDGWQDMGNGIKIRKKQ